jgi:hypothetical protein
MTELGTPELHQTTVEERFQSLARNWQAETAHLSSFTKRILNPHYQQIIGMGPPVVPFLLRDLAREPKDWFWALSSVTGENPVVARDEGDIVAMSKAWLNWGKQRGMI